MANPITPIQAFDRLMEARLLAELWRRSSDPNVRIMGADLLQVIDGDATADDVPVTRV